MEFNMSDKTHVMMTEEYGRAVFAMTDLPAQSWVEIAELLVLNPRDTALVQATELVDYVFTYDDDRDCLVMGIGEMFNHSDQPNVTYEIMSINGRDRMVFRTTREVKKGEQLFIDYSADLRDGEKKSSYEINML